MGRKIAVTGGSGGAGAFVVRELIEHGDEVTVLDRAPPRKGGRADVRYRAVDLTEFDAVKQALAGQDAVVAFAADPEPDFDFDTGARRFRNNTLCTYNVMNAACALGLEKVVWASSETVLGFPFDGNRPLRFPVREEDPVQPQNSYSLSKVLCEELAVHLHRLHGVSMAALRLSNVLFRDTTHPANYAAVPGYWDDPADRRFNLWGYIDARDAARCARLALERFPGGAETFIVAAGDTIMNRPSRELVAAEFPGVSVDDDLGEYDSLLAIDKARRLLGWEPRHSWRSELAEKAAAAET